MAKKVSILAPKDSKSFDKGEIKEVIEVDSIRDVAALCLQYHWTPAIPRDNTFRRSIESTLEVHYIGLDVDGALTIHEAEKRLEKMGVNYIIATTKSHQRSKKNQPPCDRFRIILELNEPIKNDASFKATWQSIKDNNFPEIDDACKDISRYFFACMKIHKVVDKKEPITAISALSAPIQDNTSRQVERPGRVSSKTSDFLVNLAPMGERHARMVKALFDMKQQGWSKERAESSCKAAYKMNNAKWGPEQETRIKDIFDNRQAKYAARYPALIPNKQTGEMRPDPMATENYRHLFENVLGLKLSKNVFEGVISIDDTGRAITDDKLDEICIRAREAGLSHSKELIVQYLNTFAGEAPFHPIKDPIENFNGNYKGELSRLLETIEFEPLYTPGPKREEEVAAYKTWITKWLVGCMAKLYEYPKAQNNVLVFKGAQGVGKSRWISQLFEFAADYTTESFVHGNKDDQIKQLTNFVWHIAELDSVTSKKDAADLKAFLTLERVSARGAYRRFESKGRSVCNFIASVNSADFLVDETGNRRYLVVPVRALNPEHDVDPIAVFAEAKELLENGYQYWLTPPEFKYHAEIVSHYLVDDATHDLALALEPGDAFKSATEILHYYNIKTTQANYRRLKTFLTQKGVEYARTSRKRGYKLVWPPRDNITGVTDTSHLNVLKGGGSPDE